MTVTSVNDEAPVISTNKILRVSSAYFRLYNFKIFIFNLTLFYRTIITQTLEIDMCKPGNICYVLEASCDA